MCHFRPLTISTISGLSIRRVINILIKVRKEMRVSSPWDFVEASDKKLEFLEINEIILD